MGHIRCDIASNHIVQWHITSYLTHAPWPVGVVLADIRPRCAEWQAAGRLYEYVLQHEYGSTTSLRRHWRYNGGQRRSKEVQVTNGGQRRVAKLILCRTQKTVFLLKEPLLLVKFPISNVGAIRFYKVMSECNHETQSRTGNSYIGGQSIGQVNTWSATTAYVGR